MTHSIHCLVVAAVAYLKDMLAVTDVSHWSQMASGYEPSIGWHVALYTVRIRTAGAQAEVAMAWQQQHSSRVPGQAPSHR